MRTFNEYLSGRTVSYWFEQAATLMTENDNIHPIEYLVDWVERKPYEAAFLEELRRRENLMVEAGIMQRVGQIGKDVWAGAKNMFNTQVQKGQDTWTGPMQKFDVSVQALQALAQAVGSDQNLSKNLPGFTNQTPGGLVAELQALVQGLTKLKGMIPQLQTNPASNQTKTGDQPGGVANVTPAAAPGTSVPIDPAAKVA